MRSDDADEASQPVQRLEHRRDECGVGAVAWENLADCGFNPADQFLGFLPFLIGHVRFPSRLVRTITSNAEAAQGSGWSRSSSASTLPTEEKISDFPVAGHRRHAEPRPGDGLDSDRRRLSKSAARLDARVAVTCLVDARPSGWCQRRCIAGQSERVKNRDRDRDGGQRDNRHEDHEAGGCKEPTVFHALAVGQHAMDPRRRHNGHMLFLLRGVYSGRLLWAGARMLPPGFENFGLKVGARNREAALRLTSNERLLDFFEDGSHRSGPSTKGRSQSPRDARPKIAF